MPEMSASLTSVPFVLPRSTTVSVAGLGSSARCARDTRAVLHHDALALAPDDYPAVDGDLVRRAPRLADLDNVLLRSAVDRVRHRGNVITVPGAAQPVVSTLPAAVDYISSQSNGYTRCVSPKPLSFTARSVPKRRSPRDDAISRITLDTRISSGCAISAILDAMTT